MRFIGIKPFLILLLVMTGCGDILPVKWRDGNYQLVWDGQEQPLVKQINASSLLTIVQPNVIAISSNLCFIGAKQKVVKTGGVSFYLIKKDDNKACNNQLAVKKGALSKNEFMQLSAKLKLPKLKSFALKN